MSGEGTPWYNILRGKLESTSTADTDVVNFIEREIPQEGRIFDYKTDLYVSANSSDVEKERKGELIKYFSALSNVRHASDNRYLFIGFDNSGEFTGILHRGAKGGTHIMDVSDETEIQDILQDSVYPVPQFDLFDLTREGRTGGVVLIEKASNPPCLVEQTLQKSSGSAVVAAGQGYTRDGSEIARMDNSHYRDMIEYREQLITSKLQSLTEEMGQVVGIPDNQLEDMELVVSPSETGIPIQEYLTTQPVEDLDDKLTASVKAWRSTSQGNLLEDRSSIYRFYKDRDELRFDEDGQIKAEFLFRSSLNQHIHGVEWLLRYPGDIDELFSEIISTQRNGPTITTLERILLVLGQKQHLRQIAEDNGITYFRSKAADYIDLVNEPLIDRLRAYVGDTVYIESKGRYVDDHFLEEPKIDFEGLLDKVLEDLIEDDSSQNRVTLREIELFYLANNIDQLS